MQNPVEQINQIAANTGLVLMTAAVMAGMVEIPNHENIRAILPMKAELAPVPSMGSENPLRREKEESAPHHISYNVTQRTPGRSAKK